MKRILAVALVFAVSVFFAQTCPAKNEAKFQLNPMQLFHSVMIANGFKLKEKPVCPNDKRETAMIYVKKEGDKWFQSACCFYLGNIERVLLWSQRGIPLDKFKKLTKRVFDKILYVKGRDITGPEFDDLWKEIAKCWERGEGAVHCQWEGTISILIEKDKLNCKLTIENFNPAEKPNT